MSRALLVQRVSNLTLAGHEGESRIVVNGSGSGIAILRGPSVTISHLFVATGPNHATQDRLLSLENVQRVHLESVTVESIDGSLTLTNCSSTTITDSTFRSIGDNKTLSGCPTGFQSDTVTGQCACACNVAAVADCHASNGTITRHAATVWIYFDEEAGNCSVVHSGCPYGYCRRETVTFSLARPNAQCSSGREGAVCGGCNGSLVLGSNDCRECHGYSNLALILPFALAGVAVLSFIIVFNMTVSLGTINGLLFYLNIVKLYEPYLFPDGPLPFLGQFVAWFNLDVGLEFCFYEGMSACSKMWLQFVFPVYLLLLSMLLLIVCRFSKSARTLFQPYLKPVLGTVVLLVYTKVLRTVVLIMAITRLTCGEETSRYWYVDPNIPYGSTCHLPLMAMAVLVLLLLIIPYTLFLLLFPLLQLKFLQRWRLVCRCRDKLRPITEVYAAPFYPKYQYWGGMMALQRFVLALVVSFNGNSNLALRVLVIAMVKMILTLNIGQVYTRTLNRVLDTWFVLSLMVTAAFAINDSDSNLPIESKSVIALVLAIAFLLFLGLIVYHSYLYIYRPLCQKVSRHQQLRSQRLKFEESSDHDSLEEITEENIVDDVQPSINDD